MHMVILFGMLWLRTDDTGYQAAFNRSVEAVYAGSDLKTYVDQTQGRVKQQYPVLTAVAPVGYSVLVKKQMRFSSRKFSLPGAVTTYSYDETGKSGNIVLTWSLE